MIDVTCAVIRDDEDRVLVVQHGDNSDHPGMWEFPGGKIKKDETAEECIIREIREELSISVVICQTLTGVVHDYGFRKIRLIPFVCDTIDFTISLNEHIGYRWTEVCDLLSFSLTEADIPVAEEYIALFAGKDGGKDIGRNVTEGSGEDAGKNGARIEGGATKQDKGVCRGMEELEGVLSGSISVDACRMLADMALEETHLPGQLLHLALTADHPVSFRAAWSLTMVDEAEPLLMEPLLKEMVASLPFLATESVIRSFLKILGRADINLLGENEHGVIASCCFSWLSSPSVAIAVKVYSMELLYKLSSIYPSLKGELISSLSIEMENGSAGIKARACFVLERLREK